LLAQQLSSFHGTLTNSSVSWQGAALQAALLKHRNLLEEVLRDTQDPDPSQACAMEHSIENTFYREHVLAEVLQDTPGASKVQACAMDSSTAFDASMDTSLWAGDSPCSKTLGSKFDFDERANARSSMSGLGSNLQKITFILSPEIDPETPRHDSCLADADTPQHPMPDIDDAHARSAVCVCVCVLYAGC
jgi:hypothetical protein